MLWHNYLLKILDYKRKVKFNKNKNIYSAIKIVTRYWNRATILKSNILNFDLSKSRHASINRDTIFFTIFKFASATKITLRHKNCDTILVEFSKNITVTLKSRHGKTQPWPDFARAYKYPTSFKNFPHPFSYCYSAKFFHETLTTDSTSFHINFSPS